MRKNKKGFTLVEVIVAMAVLAIMGLLVCTLYAFLGKTVKRSYSMNTNVDLQVAKYERGISGPDDTTNNKTITFNVDGTDVNVPIEYTVIDANNSNPNIKYFYKP